MEERYQPLWDILRNEIDADYRRTLSEKPDEQVKFVQGMVDLVEGYLHRLIPLHTQYAMYFPALIPSSLQPGPRRIMCSGFLGKEEVEAVMRYYPDAEIYIFSCALCLLDVSRYLLRDYPDRIHYIEGSYLETPFPDQLDAIYLSLMVSGVDVTTRSQLFAKCKAALKPKGSLLAVADLMTPGDEKVSRYYGDIYQHWLSVYYPRSRGMVDLLADSLRGYIPGLQSVQDLQGLLSGAGFSTINLEGRVMNSAMLAAYA